MIAKFMPKEKCGAAYLMKTSEGFGPREAHLIDGNIEQTMKVIAASMFANRYTSAVLSHDRWLPDEQQRKFVEEFLEVLLPGLKPGVDFVYMAVAHKEYPKIDRPVLDAAGRQKLTKRGQPRFERAPDTSKAPRSGTHVIIANTHVPTRNRLQPYYHWADGRRVTQWQELVNERHGYASPKDPERARGIVWQQNNLPRDIKAFKMSVEQMIAAAIRAGQLACDADLLPFLKKKGS